MQGLSASVVENTLDEELSRLSLEKSRETGLQGLIEQAEGITMDSRGVLYISSEPDLLYVFMKPDGK